MLRCVALWLGLVLGSLFGNAPWFCSFALAQSEPKAGTGVIDGTLRDCVMLSIDRAIAVGDTGSILVTEDSGKTWTSLSPRNENIHYAIGFDESPGPAGSRSGLIVGGTVQPTTGRSLGVVLHTKDDGKTWQPVIVPGLPRLIGLQRIKHQHWIAWGDWSDPLASSLFESIDGGRTWHPRPVPCGHLQAAAVTEDGRTVLVDRSSRVFFASDGIEFRSVPVERDPFRPIRFCKLQSQGWWMGGDAGQLWHSIDGMQWQSIDLPLNKEDRRLIDLSGMAGSGPRLWILGKPGNVIWTSGDHGATWSKRSTGTPTKLSSLRSWDEQVLIACGQLGHILQSRNGGASWKTSHASAQRTLCLSISATDHTIPWDVLAYSTHEGQQQSASVVIHNRFFMEELHREMDTVSALECLGARIHIDHIDFLRMYPISDIPRGCKATDLMYYQNANEELLKRLVLEIRTHRPDLLVIEDPGSPNPLESANGTLAAQAIQLAANPSYSPIGGLGADQPTAWTVQRTLQRSSSQGGFTLAPAMVLRTSNQLLARPLQPLKYFYRNTMHESDWEPPASLIGQARYRLLQHKSVTVNNPLEGLVITQDTKLSNRIGSKTKLAALMASANAANRVNQMLASRGNGMYREQVWDDSLLEFVNTLPDETVFDILWTLAQESRKQGNWYRWQAALSMMLARNPNEEVQEWVYREQMTYFGSAEVDKMIADDLEAQSSVNRESESSKDPSATDPSANIASPFAINDPGVQKASNASKFRSTQIAQGKTEREFAKMLGSWPESWDTKKTEPAWAWLIASRFRTSSWTRAGVLDKASERQFWPEYQPKMVNWSGLHEQELIVNSPPEGSMPLPKIPWTADRPYLDGRAEPEFWTQSISLRMSTAWAEENETSIVRLCRDQAFLFIHLEQPKSRNSELNSVGSGKSSPNGKPGPSGKQGTKGTSNKASVPQSHREAKRDTMNPNMDHTLIRLDIDRDYATWFEFGWDVEGGLRDRCNDMIGWNPEWYIAFHPTETSWNTEIAIPIATLVNSSATAPAVPWEKLPWGVSIVRECPTRSTEFLVSGDRDRWSKDQWLIMDLRPPATPIAEPDRLPSMDAEKP